jgi:hypothetical protein
MRKKSLTPDQTGQICVNIGWKMTKTGNRSQVKISRLSPCRWEELAERNGRGELSESEREELEAYINVGLSGRRHTSGESSLVRVPMMGYSVLDDLESQTQGRNDESDLERTSHRRKQ